MKCATAIAMSVLFACLTGCPIEGECGGQVKTTINMTPEEYAPWKYDGEPPAATTGATTDGAGDPGTALDPEEACEAYCRHRYAATFLACTVNESATEVAVTCDMFWECHLTPATA